MSLNCYKNDKCQAFLAVNFFGAHSLVKQEEFNYEAVKLVTLLQYNKLIVLNYAEEAALLVRNVT